MLAACAAVKTMLGVSTTPAAYEQIVWPEADDDPDHPEFIKRPRIIVEDGSNWSGTLPSLGRYVFNGEVLVSLEQPAYERADYWPENHWPLNYWQPQYWPNPRISRGDRWLRAANVFGEIIGQLLQKSGATPTGDEIVDPLGFAYPSIREVRTVLPIAHSDPAEWGGAYFATAVYAITWAGGS